MVRCRLQNVQDFHTMTGRYFKVQSQKLNIEQMSRKL